jgi:hypothetical protein
MNASTTSTADGWGRIAVIMIVAIVFLVAAIVGAYLDWIWWPWYEGIVITLAAGVILLVGGILALIGRGIVRRIALVVLAVGVGLVAGQNLGPSREPLIYQPNGTMTIHLESPAVRVATGPADCTNVASATEFLVEGLPEQSPGQAGSPAGIIVEVGDRWQILGDTRRKDRVGLSIGVTGQPVPGAGKPSIIGMQATGSSTLESSFSNAGGSIRFAHLAAQSGPDVTGESIDLAGTIEWTCGAVQP